MELKSAGISYIYMVIGEIGMLLLAFGILKYISLESKDQLTSIK